MQEMQTLPEPPPTSPAMIKPPERSMIAPPTTPSATAPPAETRWQHRLRALPHLARNMALMGCMILWMVAFIILTTETYRDGLDGTTVSVANRGRVFFPHWSSPNGRWMFGVCSIGGLVMIAFELFTFAELCTRTVYVSQWLWALRVVLYLGLSVPGLMVFDTLMPPVLPSIVFVIVSVLNLPTALGIGAVPSTKDWGWKLFGSMDVRARLKLKESGGRHGKYTSFSHFLMEAPKELYVHLWQKARVGRYLALVAYCTLNFALFVEAYVRHEASPKGRALRGEAFMACQAPGDILLPCGTSDDPNGVLVKASVTLLGRGTGHWYPVAKGFGQLLNLNCAFMVLPVARSPMRWFHRCVSHCAATSSKWALCDQFLSLLDKNIVIHKAIAKYFIMFAVVGHSMAHYANYASAPYYSQERGADVADPSPTHMAWSAHGVEIA